jgi:hypothetical protein
MCSYVFLQKSILFIVVVGSLGAIVFADDDNFPFSNYPMYSKLFSPEDRTFFWSVAAEYEDGSTIRFDTTVGAQRGLRPFWGAAFREALLVDKNPEAILKKLKAARDWQRKVAKINGLPPARTVKKLMLYKHDISWPALVELRMRDASAGPLFLESAKLVLEAE